MTTLLNLAGTPMLVPFDSSLRLQNAVDAHRSNAWRGHLRANSGLNGSRLPTHPIELLLHIGQATAFLPPPMQPITWLWPLARYLPALELTPQRRLRLKTAV